MVQQTALPAVRDTRKRCDILRVFLANVGANASHRFAGPIFEDGTFEFLPIPEMPDLSSPSAVRYRDLRSFYDPTRDLLPYIPRRLWDAACHNDPEFATFTYGDNCEVSPRASGLRQMRPGDFLFFLVRLENWLDGKPSGRFGFYLIGYLHVAEDDWALRQVTGEPSTEDMALFENNAHVIRGRSAPGLWDGFWVFRGAGISRRFHTAVPVTREFCQAVFRKADGGEWRWNGGRSDLQVIGSYTRACRRVLDPADPEDGPRARILWEWVEANRG